MTSKSAPIFRAPSRSFQESYRLLRAIGNGERIYNSTNGAFGTLAQLSASNVIVNVLGSGTKSGYVFSATPDATSPALQFTATGTPQVSTGATQTGARFFFMEES